MGTFIVIGKESIEVIKRETIEAARDSVFNFFDHSNSPYEIMSMHELYQELCYNDPRSEDYDPDNGTEHNTKDCYSDACFYGVHKWADILIKAVNTIEKLKNHDTTR